MFIEPRDSLVLSNRGLNMCICVSEWGLTAAGIWRNRGSKSSLCTQALFINQNKSLLPVLYIGILHCLIKIILLFKRNTLQKTVIFITHRRTPGCAQVGSHACITLHRRGVSWFLPHKWGQSLMTPSGPRDVLLPRITWHQGIQTLCLQALAFQWGRSWSCHREAQHAGDSKCSQALGWNWSRAQKWSR